MAPIVIDGSEAFGKADSKNEQVMRNQEYCSLFSLLVLFLFSLIISASQYPEW